MTKNNIGQNKLPRGSMTHFFFAFALGAAANQVLTRLAIGGVNGEKWEQVRTCVVVSSDITRSDRQLLSAAITTDFHLGNKQRRCTCNSSRALLLPVRLSASEFP